MHENVLLFHVMSSKIINKLFNLIKQMNKIQKNMLILCFLDINCNIVKKVKSAIVKDFNTFIIIVDMV